MYKSILTCTIYRPSMRRQFKPEKNGTGNLHHLISWIATSILHQSFSQTAPSHAPPSSFYLPPTILPPCCPCVARLGSGPRGCFSSWEQPYCFTQIYALQCLLPYGWICGREDTPVASGAVMEDRAMPFPHSIVSASLTFPSLLV